MHLDQNPCLQLSKGHSYFLYESELKSDHYPFFPNRPKLKCKETKYICALTIQTAESFMVAYKKKQACCHHRPLYSKSQPVKNVLIVAGQ